MQLNLMFLIFDLGGLGVRRTASTFRPSDVQHSTSDSLKPTSDSPNVRVSDRIDTLLATPDSKPQMDSDASSEKRS